MYNSILQLAIKLTEKICERAETGEIRDLDIMAESVLGDCKETSTQMIGVIIENMNVNIRRDKKMRKEMGLVIKEKDRGRQILTALGMINYGRDYYYDKEEARYSTPLDQMLGVGKRERIGGSIKAALVSMATDVSYAKSADIVTGGAVSRQTVRNGILKIEVPEIEPEENRRKARELHIYADEDHAHMQKPNKETGKESRIIPLVTVTEGMKGAKGRNRTIHPIHFSDKELDTKELWKSVEGYVDKAYDLEELKRIYLHGDGGPWIKNGMENYAQTIHVMDGFHFYKELRKIATLLPHRHVRTALLSALRKDNKARADEYIEELLKEDLTEKEREKIEKFSIYLKGNWKAIRLRLTEDIPGSCTEAQVSHVLSERFSRDPLGWSKEALGKLVIARIYLKNGGGLTKEQFHPNGTGEKYSEYAERILNEVFEQDLDFSMFEKEKPIFDGASGTQAVIRKIGQTRNPFIQ